MKNFNFTYEAICDMLDLAGKWDMLTQMDEFVFQETFKRFSNNYVNSHHPATKASWNNLQVAIERDLASDISSVIHRPDDALHPVTIVSSINGRLSPILAWGIAQAILRQADDLANREAERTRQVRGHK